MLILGLLFFIVLWFTTNLKNRSSFFKIALVLTVAVAILIRTYSLVNAMGLNLDEAQGAYNSWSMANYGVDAHLSKNPVYLYAWGSGMNVLYPYLAIPFIKAFGLTVGAYRFPLVLLSVISIFTFVYAYLKTNKKNSDILLTVIIIFLSPATITSSRWAIESNLFITLAIFLYSIFVLFVNEEKGSIKSNLLFALFSAVIAISAYSYSNNWLFLAVFMFIFIPYLLIEKKILVKHAIMSILVMVMILWPLGLYIYVNYLGHAEMHVLGLTITKMAQNRSDSQFVIGHGDNLRSIWHNLENAVNMYVGGHDGFIENSLPNIGIFYPFMLTFAIIGIFSIKNNLSSESNYMFISLIACIPTILLIVPNVTHYNASILPILYFESLGVQFVCNSKYLKTTFAACFAIGFLLFCHSYFNVHRSDLQATSQQTPLSLRKAVDKTKKFNGKVYVISNKPMYVITRFYDPMSPYVFNREKSNEKASAFINYDHYGKWYFRNTISASIANKKNSLFLVENGANTKRLNGKKMVEKFDSFKLYK